MSLFSRTSFFDESEEPDRLPQTVKRVRGRQIVEEPVQKYGRTVVATDDLEAWYRELNEAAETFDGTPHGDIVGELRDSVYRYLR